MRSARLALLLSLVLGLTLSLGSAARADHEFGHDHPFCAQGGGQLSDGGEGGTIPPEGAVTETNDGPIPDGTVLIPRHLGPQFGEDDPRGIDPDAQFIEIDADDLGDTAGTGSSGGPFHGGHGGGPGGGQGGSTFFGAGDGGCSPVAIPTIGRPPGRRLPVTGTSAEQFALMGAVFLILGGTFVFAPQIVNAVNNFMAAVFRRPRKQPAPAPVERTEPGQGPVVHAFEAVQHSKPVERDPSSGGGSAADWAPDPQGQSTESGSAISRLRQEINVSWGRKNGA